jgi:hypothetical protein
MKLPVKSHAAICGLSFAFCFCNLLARIKVRLLYWSLLGAQLLSLLGAQPLDMSLLGLCWHNKTLLPAELPQCPVSQLELLQQEEHRCFKTTSSIKIPIAAKSLEGKDVNIGKTQAKKYKTVRQLGVKSKRNAVYA